MNDPAAEPREATPPRPARGRLRRWLRRFAYLLLALVVLAGAVRIALPFVLPSILDSIAGDYGLRVKYERLSLSLLTGDVELWHLTVRAAEGGEEYVNLEYARINVDLDSLLSSQPVLHRVEVDGLDINLHRRADGTFALLSHFGDIQAIEAALAEAAEDSREDEPVDEPSDPDAAFDLTPPVRVDALRLQHIELRFRDDFLPPSIVARYEFNLRVSHFGHPERETRFDLLISSPEALDGLSIEGRAHVQERMLDARAEVRLYGWRPGAYRGQYLKQLGILPRAEEVDARFELVAEGRPGGPGGRHLALGVMLQGLELLADREPFFSLERAGLRAEGLRPSRLIVDFIGVRGVRALAGLSPDGALEVGPVRFLQPERLGEPVAEEGLAALLALARTRVDTRFGNAGVRQVRMRDLELHLHDASLAKPVNHMVRVEDLRLRGRSVDTALGARNIAVSARIAIPNVVEQVDLAGMVSMLDARKVIQLDVDATGVGLEGIAPYLAAAGVVPEFEGGRFSSELWLTVDSEDKARIRANAGLEAVELRAGGGELLLGLGSARLEGYLHELRGGTVSVGTIAVDGVRLAARRDGDSVLTCGFRIGAAASGEAEIGEAEIGEALPPVATEKPLVSDLPKVDADPDVAPLRRVAVDCLAYEDVKISLTDTTESPTRTLEIASAGELRDLSIPLAGASEPLATAVLSGWCTAPGLLDRLELRGRVGIQPGAVILDLGVRSEGFTGQVLAPYLAPLGLEPILKHGTADGLLSGSVRFGGDRVAADLELGGLRFMDGEEELLAADQIRLQNVEVRAGQVKVGAIFLEQPRIRVHKEESGALRAIGYRTLPPPPPPAGDEEAKPVARRPVAPAASVAHEPDPGARALVVRIDRFQVNEAAAIWVDHQTDPDVALECRVSLALTELLLGRPSRPARLGVRFAVPGLIENGGVAGMLQLGPSGQAVDLSLGATGICLDRLAPYLTARSAGSIRDGRFHARLEMATRSHGANARAFDLTVRAVDFRDGEKGPSLLGLESMRLRVPTVDLAAGLIDIDELSVAGFETRLDLTKNGGLRPCGFELPDAGVGKDEGEPAVPAGGKRRAARRPRGRVGPFPLVKLDKLDLHLRRFTVRDARFPDADPLVLSNVRLTNKKPIRALGKDVESNKPSELRIEGGLVPLVEKFEVDLTVSPFDAQPDLRLAVKATGVNGSGITRVRPDLASRMNGLPLVDGHFEMTAGVVLRRKPRHALDFNVDQGFGLELTLRDAIFRQEAGGPPLAGVGELDVDVKRIVPSTGEVWIRSIEIGAPVGRVCLADDGIHALGIVVKLPEAAVPNETAGAPAAKPETSVAPAARTRAAPSAPAVPKTPAGEIRLDRFTVTDLDFLLEDRTVEPAFRLPLESLDVVVRGFSTRNWHEKRPLRFNVSVAGGKVDVASISKPEPKKKRLRGRLAAKAESTDPSKEESTEPSKADERVSFQEVLLRGELFFFPTRHGWIKTDVSMMDLATFRGPASRSGVEIQEGVFDTDVLALLQEDGTIDVDADFAFTGLSMTEPPDGPISRYLRLPAPLDTVIFLIRDENGTVKLPLSFSLDSTGGVSTAQISQEAVKALGVVIANAVASSPFRLVGTVTDPLGITGGGREKTAGDSVPVEFATGATSVNSKSRAALTPIAVRLRDEPNLSLTLRAEMGRADVEVARVRGNPSQRDCLALIKRLRDRRDRLFTSRDGLVRRGAAALAARLDKELDEAIARLRAFDRELALIETSLDRLGELVRPGAERLAPRRTRASGTAMAQARLAAVKAALLKELGPEFDHRIRITRPRFRADTEAEAGTVEVRPTIGTLERRAAPKTTEPVKPRQTAR